MGINAHCMLCNKEYVYWRCIHNHYEKEHPEDKSLIRIREIWDSMNEEAEAFLKLPRLSWKSERLGKFE